MKGVIKSLVSEKSYGFITPEGESKDVFFHASALVGVQFSELKIGDLATFEIEQSEKGPRAVNVARI